MSKRSSVILVEEDPRRPTKFCGKCMIAGDIGFNWNGYVGCFNCGNKLKEYAYEWLKGKGYTFYEQPHIEEMEKDFP